MNTIDQQKHYERRRDTIEFTIDKEGTNQWCDYQARFGTIKKIIAAA